MNPKMPEIRNAEAGDIAGICEIERECFLSEAWCEDDFYYRLGRDGFITLVAITDGRVAGYCAISCVYDINVDSIAVAKDFRQRGIARALLQRAFDGLSGKAYLEVRSSNAPAQSLYRSLGFARIGVRKGYYDNPPEDAVVMSADIGVSAP